MNFSRRGFLKGMAAAAGAAAGTRLASRGGSLLGDARAAAGGEAPAVVLVHFIGGYNSIFSSSSSFLTSSPANFGVNAGNFTMLGNGLSMDNVLVNGMSPFSQAHVATIGVRHGISDHHFARQSIFSNNGSGHCAPIQLASLIGGTAPIKAASVGQALRDGQATPEAGVTLQTILDMRTAISVLGGGAPDPNAPSRTGSVAGLEAANGMTKREITGSPSSLTSLSQAYGASVDTLKQVVHPTDLATLQTAYGLGASSVVRSNDFKAQIAATELMITGGSNVVLLQHGATAEWDLHNDTTGTGVRNKMQAEIVKPLNVFLNRVLNDPARNVVVCMMGDFARSLPGSDHQPNLSVSVFGKYVKQGTTGKVDNDAGLPASCPGIPGLWAYLAAVAKVPGSPFGANPHALVL
jgi:hypothetical protein